MNYYFDFSSFSMNKYNEELCGDKVEFLNSDEKFIAVLSDGLGSGVKANILATLTSKIAITMLKEGAELPEVVDTILETLPVCLERNLAYSTFTIITIDFEGMVYIAEFDNPSIFYLSNKKVQDINWIELSINNRIIRESRFKIKENDILIFVSDGVIYAGGGTVLNLNWKWEDVKAYIEKFITINMTSREITRTLIGACDQLYMQKPGDDTTVATIKISKPKYTTIFTGPPKDKKHDEYVASEFLKNKGRKVICGGTSAKIIARELNQKIDMNFNIIDEDIPPIARIKGIDLVTEGMLTLKRSIEILESIKDGENTKLKDDGASKLVKILLEESTHIKFIVGCAINLANKYMYNNEIENPKVEVIKQLEKTLKKFGKIVEVYYC